MSRKRKGYHVKGVVSTDFAEQLEDLMRDGRAMHFMGLHISTHRDQKDRVWVEADFVTADGEKRYPDIPKPAPPLPEHPPKL